jgi:hypothetical protein
MTGGAGGLAPLQYKLRRPPAPQCSFAFPVHGKLQSESEAVVPPLEMAFPQSCIKTCIIRTTEWESIKDTLNRALTTLLAIFNTGVYEVLILAKTDTVLDSHIFCVRVPSRRERARSDIIPRVYKV